MAKPIPLLPPLTRMVLFSKREDANISIKIRKKTIRLYG
jgi:hypothetical protein